MSNRTVARFSPYPDRSANRAADADMQPRRGRSGARRLQVVGGGHSLVPQTVYLQSGSQAPIYNGPIAGDVNNFENNFQVYELDKDGTCCLIQGSELSP
jgi:hypothetical protein